MSVAVAAALGLGLAACGSDGNRNIRVFDGSSSSRPKPEPIRTLSAEEILNALNGKTFQYTRGDGTGLITFNSDGTSTIQDDNQGTLAGTWSANNGELCESLAGQPARCGVFKTTGDAFFSGKDRFIEMKLN